MLYVVLLESNDVITVKIATKIPLKLALDDDVTEQNCDVLMFAIERSHVHNVTSFNNSLTSILVSIRGLPTLVKITHLSTIV